MSDDLPCSQACFDACNAEVAALLARYPRAEWGGAHVVVSDGNYESAFVRYCLTECAEHPAADPNEQAATMTCLERILALVEQDEAE